MEDSKDTLNIGSIRLSTDYPMAAVQAKYGPETDHNPEDAAAARARIEALPGYMPLAGFNADLNHPIAPATPTADLITDKHVLAAQSLKAPLVRGRRLPTVVRPILTAVGVFFMVLLLFKAPVIFSQLQYSFSQKPQTPAAAVVPAAEVVPAENSISIPKINVKAPVNYEPSIAEASIQKALETGVVHYGNTAVPGQNGNVAIFGHSSNDWWEPGNFKFVFVLLDKLAPGDQLTIDYQSHRYTYEVTGSKVVEPTDVSVLNPTATPTLSIITCTPPGTSLKRLVVTAKQISPSPTGTAVAATVPSTQTAGALPSGAPSSGFFDQFAAAWQSLVATLSGSAAK
jgi:LPXTG-site transpeptidase (sortase) family protein